MKSQKLKTLHSGLILFFLCFSISPCLAQFGGGTGSEASPYLVATAQHLYNVRDYADAYFLQTGDIFLNVEPYNSGQGWYLLAINPLLLPVPMMETVFIFTAYILINRKEEIWVYLAILILLF